MTTQTFVGKITSLLFNMLYFYANFPPLFLVIFKHFYFSREKKPEMYFNILNIITILSLRL